MGYPDNVSRLGAAIEGSNLPKKSLSCAYKVPRRSPLYWSISSFASSSYVLLHFSFAIYLFPHVDKRSDFNGFHMLSTDHSQLSPRIHH